MEDWTKESKAFNNFITTLKTRATKRNKFKAIRAYLKWSKKKTYDELLEGSVKDIENNVIEYIKFVNQTSTKNVMQNHYGALRHFYPMNDIILNWDKIRRYKNPHKLSNKDRGYDKKEIEKLLTTLTKQQDYDRMLEAAIFLLASSGMRIGSLTVESIEQAILAIDKENHEPALSAATDEQEHKEAIEPLTIVRLRDLKWFEEHKLYGIRVYAGTKYEYTTFATPQASEVIRKYLVYRQKKLKEKLSLDSYLLHNGSNIKMPLPIATLQGKLLDLRKQAGLGEIPVMVAHGFRKFVDTVFVNVGLEPRKKELMMGHKLKGQENSYFKPTPLDLLGGGVDAKGYIYAIPLLTFELNTKP